MAEFYAGRGRQAAARLVVNDCQQPPAKPMFAKQTAAIIARPHLEHLGRNKRGTGG